MAPELTFGDRFLVYLAKNLALTVNILPMTDYNKIEEIRDIIAELLTRLGLHGSVDYEESITKGLVFNINCGHDSYLLIGRQGSTLYSLQILVQSIAAKKFSGQGPVYFSLDVDDYKMKREWFLKETVRAAVEHVKKTGRAAALEPMPAFERRFIHAFLQKEFPEAESSSLGEEPHRKVVIRLKK